VHEVAAMNARLDRRSFLTASCLSAAALASGAAVAAPEPPTLYGDYPEPVADYLRRLYDPARREHAFRPEAPGGFDEWQKSWRATLRGLLALDKIAAAADGHEVKVEMAEPEDLGGLTRVKGRIETEPHVRVPFWLLRPKGEGPFPLAVLPHGHDPRGHDTTAGVYHDEGHRRKSIAEDRNVGVQAAERGFVAIAPAVRGLAVDGVPDQRRRHGARNCRSQLMHCLAAGRTAMGERVWDMARLIDWGAKLPGVDARNVLMMGNSGGGMVTLYASALDERITVAVPSCSFCSLVSPTGYLYHCDCNMIPAILEHAEMWEVAGLTAPRHMLALNGRQDKLFDLPDVERAAGRTKAIFAAAGCPDHFQHRFGDAGHRFYADLMWPFVMNALGG
jgi:cephalosporin-C deacetylase-like acetyl esterase